jgi:hypothetical protein
MQNRHVGHPKRRETQEPTLKNQGWGTQERICLSGPPSEAFRQRNIFRIVSTHFKTLRTASEGRPYA